MTVTGKPRKPGMLLSVSRDVAIPLTNQIHDQVAAAVATGDLKEGDRLPTIRELAQFLGINRNTVAQAYRLLESSGHVHTRAGGGTTVAAPPATVGADRFDELRELVTACLKQAAERGFSGQEFGQLAYYEGQRWACLSRVSVLVVHDYARELDVLRQSLTSEFSAVDTKGMMLGDLVGVVDRGEWDNLADIDFALVPVRLLERVSGLLAGAPFPVLGAGIGPSIATLVEVAKQTAGQHKRVAVVCTDPAGSAEMKDALASAGVPMDDTRLVAANDPDLRKVVRWADLVVESDGSAAAVASVAGGKPVVRFSTLVNESSMATVRSYIEHVIQIKCRQRD